MCDLVYEGEGPALLNTAGDGIVVPALRPFRGPPTAGRTTTRSSSNGSDRVLGSKETGVVVISQATTLSACRQAVAVTAWQKSVTMTQGRGT